MVDHEAQHEHEIEEKWPRNWADAGTMEAHWQGNEALKEVVQVTSHAPVATDEQARLASLSSVVSVLHRL